MSKYLLAIDAGTGSVRACLFNLAGWQIGIAQREWIHLEDERYPGSMDFDCDKNWELIKQTLQELLAQTKVDPKEIIALAATSMREGIVLYDEAGREVFACANVDARAGGEVEQLLQNGNLEREIYAVSGQTFSLGAIARILWVKNHAPEIYESVRTVNMLNDWIIYKLTGKLVAEPSNGCTTGIFDLDKRCFDVKIAERCGIKTDIYPEVIECGKPIARISTAAAAQTGLSVNTLVVSGGGDAQLGGIGVGLANPGECAVFGGSFWQYECNTTAPVFDEKCRVRINCHAMPEMWQYEAIAFFPGLMMKWYKNAFCDHETQNEAAGGPNAYIAMEEKAKDIPPGCNGMVCTFSGVMDYISWRHAAPTFTDFAFDAARFNRHTFYRAIQESAAFVTRGHMELVAEVTKTPPPQKVTFAGGAAASPLWCQIIADVLQVTVRVPRVREATALGAAILAGVGAGVYENAAAAAKQVVAFEREYTPIAKNNAVYNSAYEKWREVYAAQLVLADVGITRYMWSAPGVGVS